MKHPYLLSVTIALALAGCARDDIFMGRPLVVSYRGQEAEIRTQLLAHLRQKYLVSETPDGLHVDTNAYPSESKGFLGLGPKWQEKFIYIVRVFGDRRVTTIGAGPPMLEMQIPRVEVEAQIWERQNSNFEWRRKDGPPVRQDQVREFYRDIQEFMTYRT